MAPLAPQGVTLLMKGTLIAGAGIDWEYAGQARSELDCDCNTVARQPIDDRAVVIRRVMG